jgi:hypothetical protein
VIWRFFNNLAQPPGAVRLHHRVDSMWQSISADSGDDAGLGIYPTNTVVNELRYEDVTFHVYRKSRWIVQ